MSNAKNKNSFPSLRSPNNEHSFVSRKGINRPKNQSHVRLKVDTQAEVRPQIPLVDEQFS